MARCTKLAYFVVCIAVSASLASVAFVPGVRVGPPVARTVGGGIAASFEHEPQDKTSSPSFISVAAASLALGLGASAALIRTRRAEVLARRTHAVKIYDTCIGCTLCARACPTDVLEMIPAGINPAKQVASAPRVEDCVGCKRCETACPTDFVSVRVYLQEDDETAYSMSLDFADPEAGFS